MVKAKKIQDLEGEVEDLEEQLKKCQKRQKELEDQLQECKEDREELEEQLEKCKEEKKELEDKLKECKEKCDDDLVITDDKEVAKFIMEVLDKAIPHSARIKNCRDGKHIINKDEEISDLTPSTRLLQRKEKDGLVLKIWQEF